VKECIHQIKQVLPPKSWSEDPDIIAPYLQEWRGRWQGQTPFLLLPGTTSETADMVKICAAHKTPLTTQGGNTGLVGGQIPQGEVLLSTLRMNKVSTPNLDDMSLVCGAGATLQAVQEAASKAKVLFPLSLASQGSCTIGGNLATNAGGVHVLKYGTAGELVLGLEAVLADGSIFHGLNTLRKDNTGYDLSRLLVGAEGTLGIITAATLKLSPKPQTIVRALVALESPTKALQLLGMARGGGHLSMFELMARIGLDYVTRYIPGQTNPFAKPAPYYVLIEWEFEQSALKNWCENILAAALEAGVITDAVIAKNGAEADKLLSLRENISAAQKPIGATIKHDISVPITRVPDFIRRADLAVLKHVPGCRPLSFGHFGDGNIHYNIGQPENMSGEKFMALEPQINDIVYDIVDALAGSISAEHGIGILKTAQLQKRADPTKLRTMRQIKKALDPDNIMNPRVLEV